MKRILLFLVVLLMVGCSSPKIIENTIVKTDTCYIERWQRDSIHVHDSIYVKEYVSGDTVRIVTDRWHERWRERIVRDTTYISRCDTVQVTKVETIVKPIPGWKCSLMWMGALFILISIGIVAWQIYDILRMNK